MPKLRLHRTKLGDLMAQVVITLKIMPVNPEVDFEKLEVAVKEKVAAFGGEVGKVEVEIHGRLLPSYCKVQYFIKRY